MSLHRHDNKIFYPHRSGAMPEFAGKGEGNGFNVNIAWNNPEGEKSSKISDIDY